ncbi:MAG: hypothetical protein AAFW46_12540 [Pseudomonadota bacterium]
MNDVKTPPGSAGQAAEPEPGAAGQEVSPLGSCMGVILVHGIGHARPGEVLAATTDALSRQEDAPIAFDDHTEVNRFQEARAVDRHGHALTFPCHIRRGRSRDQREFVFAELHWSDVKSIDTAKANPLLLFLSSILQAHRVIAALLAGRRDPFAALLRPLLLLGAFLLRGPIVGLNLVMIVMLLAIKYCVIATQTFGWNMEGYYFVLGGLAFSAVLGLILISRRPFGPRLFAEIGWAMLAISVAGAALAYVALGGQSLSRFNEFAFFAKGWVVLIGLWTVLSAIVLLGAALLALSLLTFARKGGIATNRSAVLALAILVVQSVIWAVVMRVIWLTLGPDLVRIIDLGALPEVTGAETLLTLQITVLLNILILAAIFAVTALVGVSRFFLARFLPTSRATRLPRLMFSPLSLNLALVIGVGGYLASVALLFSRTGIGELAAPFAPGMAAAAVDMALPMIQQRPLEFAASTLVVLSPAALFLFGRTLTTSSMLLQDIIDYHPENAAMVAGRGGAALQPRDRIGDRFAQLVQHLEAKERVNALMLVAHSQGTVIAHDFLREGAGGSKSLSLSSPADVITLGSPLRHIYAHYFADYAGFEEGLDRIGPGVRSWTNFFRVDDAIGTRLSAGPVGFVEERALPPGGHANYWSEQEVSGRILECLNVAKDGRAPASDRVG